MIDWINGFDAGNKKEKYFLEFRLGTLTLLEIKWISIYIETSWKELLMVIPLML